jgi:hypothetical protein
VKSNTITVSMPNSFSNAKSGYVWEVGAVRMATQYAPSSRVTFGGHNDNALLVKQASTIPENRRRYRAGAGSQDSPLRWDGAGSGEGARALDARARGEAHCFTGAANSAV